MTIIVSVHLKHLQCESFKLSYCVTPYMSTVENTVCVVAYCIQFVIEYILYSTYITPLSSKSFDTCAKFVMDTRFFFSELEQASSHILRKFIYKFMLFLLKFYAYVTVCHFMAAILCRMQCRNAVRVLFRITPGEK